MNILKSYIDESRKLLKLTGPIILGQLSITAMGFVDTVMAGRVSPVDLAAVAVGSSFFFPLFLFLIGVVSAVTPLVAQAHGRNDKEGIVITLQQGLLTGLITGFLLLVVILLAMPLLELMQISSDVIPKTKAYLFAVSWGLPIGGLFLAFRNGGDGLSQPRLAMIAGFTGLLANIIANYILIYGKFGFPAMGGVGCGWATSFSMLVMFAVMYILLQKSSAIDTTALLPESPVKMLHNIHKLIWLGLPVGVSLFVECSIFSVIALIISRFGAEIVSSHQIALNFSSLLFMLPYSLSIALSVRVGFTVGQERYHHLKQVLLSGLTMATCCGASTCLFIILLNTRIAEMYTPDTGVQILAAKLLLFAAVFQFSDALQVNCAGALRGLKDTTVPMVLMVISYWGIGLPVGCLLGLGKTGSFTPGPEGFWVGLICGLTTSAILLGNRLYSIAKRFIDRPLKEPCR